MSNLSISSNNSQFLTASFAAKGGDVPVKVLLSSKNASPGEHITALLSKIGFTNADLAAYKEQYGVDLRAELEKGLVHHSESHKKVRGGYEATINVPTKELRHYKQFLAERRSASEPNKIMASAKKPISIINTPLVWQLK